MRSALLPLLRCPFCGVGLTLGDWALEREADRVRSGVLTCECCAWPIVDGIPYLRLDDARREALEEIEAGHADRALLRALDAPAERRAALERLVTGGGATFRDLLAVFLTGEERVYALHRFSDPTFVAASQAARTFMSVPRARSRPVLEVCGGFGHLARTLAAAARTLDAPRPLTSDAEFWRVWLAARIVAPDADAICCDANVPLPVAEGQFAVGVCNDALHYVWAKRLLADELLRAVGDEGLVAFTHVHSALAENPNAGNVLTPSAYLGLFGSTPAMAAAEGVWLDAALAADPGAPLVLADVPPPNPDEPVIWIAASRCAHLVTTSLIPVALEPGASVAHMNPLYRIDIDSSGARLTLAVPSPEYGAEFAALARYLPESLTLPPSLVADPEHVRRERPDLLACRVVLMLPPRYL